MTVREGLQRQAALSGEPWAIEAEQRRKAAEAELRQAAAARWTTARMRQIDHRIAMDRIKRQGERCRATLARIRRLEEETVLIGRATEWKLAHTLARLNGTPVSLSLASQRQRHLIETQGLTLDRQVPAFRAHLAQLLKAHRITWSTAAHYVNAYAFTTQRAIETADVHTAETYAVCLHEIGHILNPCDPSRHHRVGAAAGSTKTVCVVCEVAAWTWAITNAIAWTREMHDEMADALGTYRRYATAEEASEIDALTSALGFHRSQLQRAVA